MIVKLVEIYDRTAEKHKLDETLVRSIGESVFKELLGSMLTPKFLAYELDHVGTFAVRHHNFRKLGRYVNDRAKEVVKRFEAIPPLIQEFQTKKLEFKIGKDEYREAKEKSKDQSN